LEIFPSFQHGTVLQFDFTLFYFRLFSLAHNAGLQLLDKNRHRTLNMKNSIQAKKIIGFPNAGEFSEKMPMFFKIGTKLKG
jgi:hypothetical protein